jgi:hypothetical protein
MTTRALLFFCTTVLFTPAPASGQGGSELFLARIRDHNGRLSVDTVLRLTNRVGYDNQPAFVPGSNRILYTVIDSTTRADIWSLDLERRTAAALTRTSPESEYSATPMPGSGRFSVVRVEADSTQRLWSFAGDGSDPRIVLRDIKPVGYHLWLNATELALFVLGNPPTLQIADIRSGTARVVASSIGRALQKLPSANAFSFVQRRADGTLWIMRYDMTSGSTTPLVAALPQNEYHVWLNDSTLVSANGSVLYQWRPGDRGWIYVADLSGYNVSGISRLALSADARSLAIVAADPPVQTGQNPSPMVETSRAHLRVPRVAAAGVRDSFPGPADRNIQFFIPAGVKRADNLSLVIHFHGSAAFVSEYAAAQLGDDHVIATVQLGSGSGIYDRSFSNPLVYDTLIANLQLSAARALGRDVAFKRIILSGWSAGYGAVRAILRDSTRAESVDGVLLLDGLHTGYIPDRRVVAEGGQIDTANFPAFLRYARWAIDGRKRFLITHSEIFPGTFASTTESANYMLRALGLQRKPVLEWGVLGMQQTSEARAGRFEVRGYAGNAGPDHVDHLHALDYFIRELERFR